MSNFAYNVPPMDAPPWPPVYSRDTPPLASTTPCSNTSPCSNNCSCSNMYYTSSYPAPQTNPCASMYPSSNTNPTPNTNMFPGRDDMQTQAPPDYTFNHPDFEVSAMVFEAYRMSMVSGSY